MNVRALYNENDAYCAAWLRNLIAAGHIATGEGLYGVCAVNEPQGAGRIPIAAAQRIAKQYGYDQVVIIARKVGESGGEHVTTYGRDAANCAVAAQIGNFLKHKIMGWPVAEDDISLARRALDEWFGGRKNWPPVHKLDALIASVAYEARMGRKKL